MSAKEANELLLANAEIDNKIRQKRKNDSDLHKAKMESKRMLGRRR